MCHHVVIRVMNQIVRGSRDLRIRVHDLGTWVFALRGAEHDFFRTFLSPQDNNVPVAEAVVRSDNEEHGSRSGVEGDRESFVELQQSGPKNGYVSLGAAKTQEKETGDHIERMREQEVESHDC